MKKYLIAKACSWKSFVADVGVFPNDTLTESDLKTADGKPLPKAVVDHLLRRGAIAEVVAEAIEQ